jgi:hypothetical protein
MDVLEYWHPAVNWSRFAQGAVSERIWRSFSQLVQLCHAHEHWKRAAQQIRLSPPGAPIYGSESKYQRNKRRDEWKREIQSAEGHMHRAGFLAAEMIASMSYLLTNADEGTPDWNLYWALRLAVRHQPHHERARCKAAAFDAFIADEELKGEPPEIATRWLHQAGYTDLAV